MTSFKKACHVGIQTMQLVEKQHNLKSTDPLEISGLFGYLIDIYLFFQNILIYLLSIYRFYYHCFVYSGSDLK